MPKKIMVDQELRDQVESVFQYIETFKRRPVMLHAEKHQEFTEPNMVIASAFDKLEEVMLAGVDKEGNFYFASSTTNGGTALWLLEHFKMAVLSAAFERTEEIEE